MSDQRYAPPQAPVRDLAYDELLRQRPRHIVLAIVFIGLCWLCDLPAAYHLYAQAPDDTLPLFFEGGALLVLGGIAYALYRGRNWGRWTYLLLTVGLITLVLLADPDAEPQPLYVDICDVLSYVFQVLPLPLLFFGAGARWFRALRD